MLCSENSHLGKERLPLPELCLAEAVGEAASWLLVTVL